jgi:hypothetical protein
LDGQVHQGKALFSLRFIERELVRHAKLKSHYIVGTDGQRNWTQLLCILLVAM